MVEGKFLKWKTLEIKVKDIGLTKVEGNRENLKKVHSLIDKVYQPTNLRMAWEKVRSNKGAGGVDKETISSFEVKME